MTEREQSYQPSDRLRLVEPLGIARGKGPLPQTATVHPPDAGEASLRRDLVRQGRAMARLGFTPGTSGNLSVRLDAERLLATPTGIPKCLIRPADIVITDMCGRLLQGSRRVTSEISMHLAVYRSRPDVAAVIHAHPATATAFACAGRGLDRALCQEAVMTLGPVPLARYATTGTDHVAASLVPYLQDHEAILLENHGAVSYGVSLQDASMKMETLEHLAQIALIAHQLGTPRYLEEDQVQQLHAARARYARGAAE